MSAAATTGVRYQRQPLLQHQDQDSYQQLRPGRLRSVRRVADEILVAAEEVQSAHSWLENTGLTIAWRAFATASAGTIEHLVDVYLQVVYPIFPLFHRPTLLQKVRDQDYLRDQGCFASLMAACALASARERDGALYCSITNASYNANIPSETFYKAARDMLPESLVEADGLDYMRACALLSITSIQYGDIEAMQLYLGHYFTLVSVHRLHDEANWPKDTNNVEVEERRRLYWSTYTLDIYSSIVWNGSVHACGANARVRYPTEVEDEFITHGATLLSPRSSTSWLRGWNFTTDLYLALEHASNRLRARQSRIDDRIDVAAVFGIPASSSAAVLATINARHSALPAEFKMFAPPTGDRVRDIFGFQAANIQATMLLLRMLLFCTDDDGHSPSNVQLKCNIAAELLAIFQTIPTAYLCGISTPLIYHLAGIGMILASVMEGLLSEAGYQKVKSILLSIADLLESFESGLSRAADISKGLRSQVERIDEYMRVQRLPADRPYVQPQPNHTSSVETARMSLPLQQHSTPSSTTGIQIAGGGDKEGHTQSTGVSAEGQFMNDGWLGEFQLPPELLEDWPWTFNLQPETWSLLGTATAGRDHW
ncbi:hypothetical protein C7974DRAFT_405556 [Boeremia exigua]|uniref:uncharacterized protein n=1 Tax=Boeremia exigua TaxID=749465 RepID=UPI001E8ECB88|nr:uncharacterized protein C7974DRAFT_405556 [Boeremia exigua]KAH6612437.1 hypothetical protein C7974DRAFT_405556 [Boeremia exigua]